MPSNSYLSQTNTCLTNSTNLTNTNLTNTNLNEVYKKDRIHQSWSSVHSVLVHQTRSIRQLCTLLFWVSGNHFGLVIMSLCRNAVMPSCRHAFMSTFELQQLTCNILLATFSLQLLQLCTN